MEKISFLKMHGAGNDFIMIDDMAGSFSASGRLISALCSQHTGIGADGLILLRPLDGFDFIMNYFNRDGGEAEMCGNGARCAATFAQLKGIAGPRMTFQTGAGPVSAEITGTGVMIDINDVTGLRLGLIAGKDELEVGFAICGVPHAVHTVSDVETWDGDRFSEAGASVRMDPVFAPDGVNFNIVSIIDRHNLRYRTFERGVEAETLACGTGAVAIVAVCSAMGLVDAPVSCMTSSGATLEVGMKIGQDGASDCTLLGPTTVTFSGEFNPSDFGA